VEPPVFGRELELAKVEETLARARSSFSALVLEGEPGIGKTTIWRAGIARATSSGFRVLACRAAQAEARLSFTALADLLAPVEAAAFDALPEPQRRALDAALLRAAPASGAEASPRAIGTGLVTLLSALARAGPVLVAMDDVQWLDGPSARALEFAIRRSEGRPIAVLATRRIAAEPRGGTLLARGSGPQICALSVGPLSLAALYKAIETQLGRKLPRPLLMKIERACGGNPFFALEIARALPSSGGATSTQELPIPADLAQLVAVRLRRVSRRTWEALFRASALARPTLDLVDAAALAPAEAAGLVLVHGDGRIDFVHPLFASAVYAAASAEHRRRLHAELAELPADVEERARHRLLARTRDSEDEHLAHVLHEAAEHALRRGAPGTAAELEEDAARFTPCHEADARRQRSLRAARHHLKAGDPARSRSLCEAVLGMHPPTPERASALHLLAEAALAEQSGASISLLRDALACVGDDVARAAHLEIALGVVLATSQLDLAGSIDHLSRAVELAGRARDDGLLAEALATRAAFGLVAGRGLDERLLERALALEDPDREVPFHMSALLNVANAYLFVGRIDVARRLLSTLRERLEARGDESDLPWVWVHLAATSLLGGELERAQHEASEAERAATLTGSAVFRAYALNVRANARALRGDTEGARRDATEALSLSERVGFALGVSDARWALGGLALAESEPESAAALLEPVITEIEAHGVFEWPAAHAAPDAIEALVATQALERAARLARALGDWGERFQRPWALATSGRCLALQLAAAGDLEGASAASVRALLAHEHLPFPIERARTLLVKGQIERRSGARRAARATLLESLSIFERSGARLWAERARAELARIGVRRAPAELTESEERVAELAAGGLTNPEIAARLFMARRTVEANLARAYRKLEIRSRAELGVVLARRKGSPPS
jgi:DNA-binding CsgD family transcriptional regulator